MSNSVSANEITEKMVPCPRCDGGKWWGYKLPAEYSTYSRCWLCNDAPSILESLAAAYQLAYTDDWDHNPHLVLRLKEEFFKSRERERDE